MTAAEASSADPVSFQPAPATRPTLSSRPVAPYETPPSNGRCYLLELPEEVLPKIFTQLDRASLTRCYRLCKSLHSVLSSSARISLHHTLLCNSLLLNPNALIPPPTHTHLLPPSTSSLLSTLRERLTRFRNFTPKHETTLELQEPEGRLYEFLEGVLVRGVGGRRTLPRELAFYDTRRVGEWEEVRDGQSPVAGEEGEEEEVVVEDGDGGGEGEAEEVRTSHKFDMEIADFAIDPGMDLLVLAQVKRHAPRHNTLHFHLLSLSTYKPHPLAAQQVFDWPLVLHRAEVSLGFQICDDGLFVLNHHRPGGLHDHLCGWQWTTGRLAVTLKATPTMSFESFILLTPSAFVVPTIVTHLDPHSGTQDELDNPIDLSWTHHLHLYAFPPFSSIAMPKSPADPLPPPHTAIHIATLDLPSFHVDIAHDIPPPRLTIRTDPPPRHTFPTHPVHKPEPFAPEPESGLVVMEIHCQVPDNLDPHFAMCLQKSTLIRYLPAPTSPLLFQAWPRPAPVVPWASIAPYVRMLGPDIDPASWVCYVYQNRYVLPMTDTTGHRDRAFLRLFDFEPLRVRKEICDRRNALPPTAPVTVSTSSPPPKRRSLSFSFSLSRRSTEPDPATPTLPDVDGDQDGLVLVTQETVLEQRIPLTSEIRTGSKLPYMYVDKESEADVALIDGERIVAIENEHNPWDPTARPSVEVMEF